MPSKDAHPPTDLRRAWLAARFERLPGDSMTTVGSAARLLGIATGDAVSVRALSRDREALVPLAAEHPDPYLGEEMLAIMRRTAQSAHSGIWRAVIDSGRPRRWAVATAAPDDATSSQADFIARFSVRSILGVPVTTGDGVLVGGVSLVRLFDDRPFADEDEELAVLAATRLAQAVQSARD